MKDIFRKIAFAIPWTEADRQLRKRLISNDFRISSQEILDIEFGLNFLRENEITDIENARINILSHYKDEISIFSKVIKTFTTLGYVYVRRLEKDQVYYNPVLLSPLSIALLAVPYYLGIGLTQTLLATGSITSALITFPLLTLGLISSTKNALVSNIITMPFKSFAEIIGHEHIHILQKNHPVNQNIFSKEFNVLDGDLESIPRTKMDDFGKMISEMDSFISMQLPRYLRQDAEVQARLHTIMVSGAKRWGGLPQNRGDLILALDEAGIHLPKSMKIAKDLLNAKAEHQPFKRSNKLVTIFNRQARKITNPAIAEMNSAMSGWIQEDAKIAFCTESIPFLYGHWLELIGDKNGLKKMGFETKHPQI